MNNKKILLLTLVHPDFLPPVYAVAQVLRDLGYRIHILTFDSYVPAELNLGSNIELEMKETHNDPESLQVRRIVASNPNTPAEVLSRLATDKSPAIRRCVAENPRTPHNTLSSLAKDVDPDVRLAISDNCRITSNTLSTLVKDPDVDIRYAIAENHQMPDEVLLALVLDENPYVRCRAIKTIERLSPNTQTRLQALITQSLLQFRLAFLNAGAEAES